MTNRRPQPGSEDAGLVIDPIEEIAEDWVIQMKTTRLSLTDSARFDAWISADPRHRAAYDEVFAFWDGVEPLREEMLMAAEAHIREESKVPPLPFRRRVSRLALMGALAASLAFASIIGTDLTVGMLADHQTAVGEQAQILLPDGSKVSLNTDSAISVDFSGGQRRIALLRGEAEFDVVHDPNSPFTVDAVDGRTTVIGTVFNIRDFGDQASVTVSEGQVRVASPEEGGAGLVKLSAGEKVVYQSGEAPGAIVKVDLYAERAWRDRFVSLKNVPLADALAEIDRYKPGRIVLLANDQADEHVSVRLSLDTLDTGINAMAATIGLRVTRIGSYLTILR